MKKVIAVALIAALFFAFGNLNAQTTVKVGARTGLSFANLSFDPDIQAGLTKSSRTGFMFGGLVEIGFMPALALQVEPMYAGGGSVIDNINFGFAKGKVTFKLSYLEIPILLKYKIPVPGDVSPYIFAGPNMGFVLSAKELDEAGGQSAEGDVKDEITSTDFGLDFGAGAGFNVAPKVTIILDARYSLGLSNLLSDKGKQNYGTDQKIKSTAFQIVAGVMFGL